eukprot:227512_1
MAVFLVVVFFVAVNQVLSMIANPPICNSIEFEWDCETGSCRYQSTQPVNVCAGNRTSGVGHSTMYYCHNNHVWRQQWDSSETCQGTPYTNELMSNVIANSNYFGDYAEACDLQLCNYVKISVFSSYPTQGQCENKGSDSGDYYDEMHINAYCIGLNDYMGGTQDYSLRWDCDSNQISQNSWIGVSDCSTSYDVLYRSSVGNAICVPLPPLYAYEYKNIECATATPFPTTAPSTPPVTSQPSTFVYTTPSVPYTSTEYVYDEPQNDFEIENSIVWIIVGCIGCCLLLTCVACIYRHKPEYSVIKKVSISSIRTSTIRSVSTVSTGTGETVSVTTDGATTTTMGVDSGEGDDDVFGEGNTNDMDGNGAGVILTNMGETDGVNETAMDVGDTNDTSVVPIDMEETDGGNGAKTYTYQ